MSSPLGAAAERLYQYNGVDVPGHPWFEEKARSTAEAQAEEAFDAASEAGWRFLRLDDEGLVIEEWNPPL